MSKWVCDECEAEFDKYHGKCPNCGWWNTVEEVK